MPVICRKVGNSVTATIPNEIIKKLGIKPGDKMNISEENGIIILVPLKRKLRGEAFIESYYGKAIEEIEGIETEKVDWGEPKGGEVW